MGGGRLEKGVKKTVYLKSLFRDQAVRGMWRSTCWIVYVGPAKREDKKGGGEGKVYLCGRCPLFITAKLLETAATLRDTCALRGRCTLWDDFA